MATRVYIGRLPRDARERDVEKLFRGYGNIREIKLMNGFGFVEFRDHRDADDVVYTFNGKTFLGEKLIVEYARGERRRRDRDDRRDRDRDDRKYKDKDRDDRRRDDRDRDRGGRHVAPVLEHRFAPPQRNPQYRLIVENLSSSCSWQDLKDLMRKAGDVTFADCHKDREGEGVVEFSSYEDMKAALRKFDDTELKGKHIILREAPDNDTERDRLGQSREVPMARNADLDRRLLDVPVKSPLVRREVNPEAVTAIVKMTSEDDWNMEATG
ncbi:9164_t:CDS:2 [Paraglomus brasilianum]|uniref:9164_t:CDS:1 n=1 Tax=Paraglomus brasilianum TaxID=144538 RepID=A0A9N9CJ66_9GLOM|nr:9164_t:CDS:2 [Paraglomus brasilianum]